MNGYECVGLTFVFRFLKLHFLLKGGEWVLNLRVVLAGIFRRSRSPLNSNFYFPRRPPNLPNRPLRPPDLPLYFPFPSTPESSNGNT